MPFPTVWNSITPPRCPFGTGRRMSTAHSHSHTRMTQVAAFSPVKPSPANCHLAGGPDRASGPQERETSPWSSFPGENTHWFNRVAPEPTPRDGKDRALRGTSLSSCYPSAAFQGRWGMLFLLACLKRNWNSRSKHWKLADYKVSKSTKCCNRVCTKES